MENFRLLETCLEARRSSNSIPFFLEKLFNRLQTPLSIDRLVVFRDKEILASCQSPDFDSEPLGLFQEKKLLDTIPEGSTTFFRDTQEHGPSGQPFSHPFFFSRLKNANENWGYLLVIRAPRSGKWSEGEAGVLLSVAFMIETLIENGSDQDKLDSVQIQALSRQLVLVQENERRTIARELHDEATQSLSSLLIRMKLLEMNCKDPNSVQTQIQDLRKMTAQIMNNLHRLAVELRPPTLDHLGIVAALEQLIDQVNREKLFELQFEVVGQVPQNIDPQVKTALYRITQEALMNIRRHSQATQSDIVLEVRPNSLTLIIEDNGVGFNPITAMHTGRLGLIGMRERAEALGGSLFIESQSSHGTTIFAEIPYQINPDIS